MLLRIAAFAALFACVTVRPAVAAEAQPAAAPPAEIPAAPISAPDPEPAAPKDPATAPVEPAAPVPPPSAPAPFVQVRLAAELGMLAPLAHRLQFSKGNSRFDYVGEGGQDTLFFFARIAAELELAQRHTLTLLYQPLDLRTSAVAKRDLTIDNVSFPEGTPLDLRYGFDFYRLSYLYDFFPQARAELSIGASLQLRNAYIVFTSADGSDRVSTRDIGPVPLFKLRGKYVFDSGFWLGGELDGIYAPIKYLNGGASDVVGALLDLSVRAGFRITRALDLFLNVRYIGGGAEGTSDDDAGPGDGYNSNWLHFLTVSLGTEVHLHEIF